MVNNIRNNAISEIDAKKGLNELNEIKYVEIIKYKKRTPGHKKLLNLFNDLLNVILTYKTLESENQENENENEKVEKKKMKMEIMKMKMKMNMEMKMMMKTMGQDKKNEIIKDLYDNLDGIIDKSKSFEEQIKSLKKLGDFKGYWPYKYFCDKELKSKYFKIQLSDVSNDFDEKLFEQTFGHTLIKRL